MQSPDDNNPYAPPQTNVVANDGDTPPLASHWQRLAAVIVDGIVLMIVMVPLMIVFFGGFMAYGERIQSGGFLAELMGSLFGMVIYIAINGYWLARDGQSVGKKVIGTRIVRSDGSKADLQRILLRRYIPFSLLYVIPIVGYLLSLINALMIFRSSRKCFHDDIADTIVVLAGKS
jgi:uncharacterized RDD family membrane protein YckC